MCQFPFFFEGTVNKPQYPSQFYQFSTLLFNTLVIKKLTDVSKSGLAFFIINKKFATIEWDGFTFFLLHFLASFFTSNNLLVAGDETDVMTSSPNSDMYTSNCLNILTCIMLSFISILIPKKVCLLPLTPDRSRKCFFSLLMIYDLNARFLGDSFLSFTYQAIVRSIHSIILFTAHLS